MPSSPRRASTVAYVSLRVGSSAMRPPSMPGQSGMTSGTPTPHAAEWPGVSTSIITRTARSLAYATIDATSAAE